MLAHFATLLPGNRFGLLILADRPPPIPLFRKITTFYKKNQYFAFTRITIRVNVVCGVLFASFSVIYVILCSLFYFCK